MRCLKGPKIGAARGARRVYVSGSAAAMALHTVLRATCSSLAICRRLFLSLKYARRIFSRSSTLIILSSVSWIPTLHDNGDLLRWFPFRLSKCRQVVPFYNIENRHSPVIGNNADGDTLTAVEAYTERTLW